MKDAVGVERLLALFSVQKATTRQLKVALNRRLVMLKTLSGVVTLKEVDLFEQVILYSHCGSPQVKVKLLQVRFTQS